MTRPAAAGSDVQAVVFNLGGEAFALPVGTVREILDYREAFRMPQGPDWFAGLIDVRGESIAMVNLRIRLGLPAIAIGVATRILVVDVTDGRRRLTLGLIVDRVLDVGSFPAAAIETKPDIGVRWRSEYIEGVVRRQDGFVVLLAAARIFTAEDGVAALDEFDQAA